LKVTILGSGTSQGVPLITCQCKVCSSNDPRDNRLRCSILIEQGDQTIVIDTGPDFRQQMLRAKVKKLDAVVFTHSHKDHIAGMDDIRAFNYSQKRDMDVYASQDVEEALKREFFYVFMTEKHPGVPSVQLHTIRNESFQIADVQLQPIAVWHHKMPVFGFRIGNFAYITDANLIPAQEMDKLQGLDILILNALRKESHISHFNLEQALEIIDQLKPKKAYLTHISHQFGLHAEEEALLPHNVFLAYDGLELQL
jgi:phosphoribosyl 1,2-cyclic phosphate phosphodiesterase